MQEENTDVTENLLYCKVCDVAFNSNAQAKQHYNGRNHQRRLKGEPPLPKGFFNPVTGKWQRQPPSNIQSKSRRVTAKKQKFVCTICNVTVLSRFQLEAHLNGMKHRTKVMQLDYQRSSTTPALDIVDSLLATVMIQECPTKNSTPRTKNDFSMYRTPSGRYYCSSCNLTLNSESQFSQHIDSKKHKTKFSVHKYTECARPSVF